MKLEVTRRDVMRFAGGAAVGVALSPMPWSLTDDLSIWSQNWGWIPKPPKGARTTSTTVCALCPAACPLEAHCVGGSPIALRTATASPGSCTLGLTGHHLPWHPTRITHPVRVSRGDSRPAKTSVDEVVRAVAASIGAARAGAGSVVVLDTRPGRSVSWAWQRLLAGIDDAAVVATPGLEGSSLDLLGAMSAGVRGSVVLDFARARTIVSFGAPIGEGWGHLDQARRDGITLIQIEPVRSLTAEVADRWLPAKPGTEAVLALGIANVLIAEGLVDSGVTSTIGDFPAYSAIVSRFPLDRVAAITGLLADDIAATARAIATNRPTIVVAGEQPGGGPLGHTARVAILGLNLLLGNASSHGAVVERAELPAPRSDTPLARISRLEELPDHSIALLVIDASAGDSAFPWPVVSRKLVSKGALVVALSPFLAGTARHADLVVPTAPFLEALHELPTPFDATAPTLALAAQLVPPRKGAIDPAAFIRLIANASKIELGGEWKSSEELIRERVARIHEAGAGSVIKESGGAATPIAEVASADELWKSLVEGGHWCGERTEETAHRTLAITAGFERELTALGDGEASSTNGNRGVTLVPRAYRDTTLTAAVSPVLSKLYRESALRRSAGNATVNPRTAASLGLDRARTARLVTAGGAFRVALSLDEGVMPGVVELAVAPGPAALGEKPRPGARATLDLFSPADDGSWSSVDAELLEG